MIRRDRDEEEGKNWSCARCRHPKSVHVYDKEAREWADCQHRFRRSVFWFTCGCSKARKPITRKREVVVVATQ